MPLVCGFPLLLLVIHIKKTLSADRRSQTPQHSFTNIYILAHNSCGGTAGLPDKILGRAELQDCSRSLNILLTGPGEGRYFKKRYNSDSCSGPRSSCPKPPLFSGNTPPATATNSPRPLRSALSHGKDLCSQADFQTAS